MHEVGYIGISIYLTVEAGRASTSCLWRRQYPTVREQFNRSLMIFIKIEPSIDHGSDIEVAARSQGVEMLNSLQNEKVTWEIQNSTLKAQFEKAIELANQSKSL